MIDNSDKVKTTTNQYDRIDNNSPSLSATNSETCAGKGKQFPSDNSDNSFGQINSCALGDALTADQMNVQYVLPRLHEGGDDPTKWYVEFYCLSPEGILERFKRTKGFAECNGYEEMKARGKSLCLILEDQLKSGWTPFLQTRKIYDNLQYKATSGKKPRNTVEYCLNIFAEAKKREVLQSVFRDKSYTTYLTKLRVLVTWLKQNDHELMLLGAFTKEHARIFLEDLQAGIIPIGKKKILGKRISNKTYNTYLQTLETAWNWLENFNENLFDKNPWKKFKPLPVSSKRQITFSEIQREKIFSHLYDNDRPLWIICRLIYQTFIRPGREMSGLQISDIDLSQNKIWIEQDISKNKKTQWVPLPEEVKKELEALRLQQYPATYYLFGKTGPSDNSAGKDYWSKRFTKMARKIGIPRGQTIYTFKHTGNQVAHLNSMPLKKQQELNRHHSLDQMDVYLRGMQSADANELKKYFKD